MSANSITLRSFQIIEYYFGDSETTSPRGSSDWTCTSYKWGLAGQKLRCAVTAEVLADCPIAVKALHLLNRSNTYDVIDSRSPFCEHRLIKVFIGKNRYEQKVLHYFPLQHTIQHCPLKYGNSLAWSVAAQLNTKVIHPGQRYQSFGGTVTYQM